MKRQEIIGILEGVVDKWFKIPQKIRMHNHLLKYHPELLSITVKQIEEYSLEAKRGGAITDSDDVFFRETSVRADTLVGENRRYLKESEIDGTNGCVASSRSLEIPINNQEAARRCIEDEVDKALKDSFGRFLERIRVAVDEKIKNFIVLSNEEPVEHYGSEKHVKVDTAKLTELVESLCSEIENHPAVIDSSMEFDLLKTNRYLVSAERKKDGSHSWTKIFTSDIHCHITMDATVKNQDGRRITLSRRILSTNYKEALDEKRLYQLKDELLNEAEVMANSKDASGGLYNVVFSGGALGILFHEAVVAHLLSSKQMDNDSDNTNEDFDTWFYDVESTPFADQLGKRIMPAFINIYDDPTLKDGWASFEYDEQGVSARRKCLIENGVLRELLLDRYRAGRRGMKSNGCSRAEYCETPEPRVSTITLETSEGYPPHTEEDLMQMMIEDCKKEGMEFGLYIDSTSGAGEVRVNEGAFTQFSPKIMKIYTDGRREACSGLIIKEMSMGVINRIAAIANNSEEWRGFCGSTSGMIPQTEIMPAGYAKAIEFHKENITLKTERLDKNSLGPEDNELQ